MNTNIATHPADIARNDILMASGKDCILVKTTHVNTKLKWTVWTLCPNHAGDYIGPSTCGKYRTKKLALEYMGYHGLTCSSKTYDSKDFAI